MYKECRHVMPSGLHCQSPAMRGSVFCYFHSRAQRPALPGRPRDARIEIPAVLDSEGMKTGISRILQALASGVISTRRAGALLYGIQMAAGAQFSLPAAVASPRHPSAPADAPKLPGELAAELDALLPASPHAK